MIKLQIRRYGKAVLLIAILAVAAIASTLYILSQERLKSPFAKSYTVNAAFPTVAGVAPGLGLPVNVSGVQVGQITGASVKGGQGVLRLAIDPKKLPRIYGNARAVLVPNSPLKDMQVNLKPGGRPARPLRDGGTIGIGQTTSPIDSDDLLNALDGDTRSWLVTLLTGLDGGTTGRTADLNSLFRALGPTAHDAAQVSAVLAKRRRQVSRLTTNLAVLTRAAGSKDREIGRLVESSNAVLRSLAGEDLALRSSVTQLPPTLRALRSTLGHTTQLANALGPAVTALTPTARHLDRTLRDSQPLLQGGGLLPIAQVKAFTNAVLPVAGDLGPTARALNRQRPALTTAFSVLSDFTNELAYDPPGRNPGFLYWLAWFAHNVNSTTSVGDANGAIARGLLLLNCSQLTDSIVPQLASAAGPATGPVGQLLPVPAVSQATSAATSALSTPALGQAIATLLGSTGVCRTGAGG